MTRGRTAPLPLKVEPLTRAAFRPFGEVIETEGARHYPINQGTSQRFHDLAALDVTAEGGRPLVSIFRGQSFSLPIAIDMVERHPLGSQAFVPLAGRCWLVVVAESGPQGLPERPRAFLAGGRQGVNYARGTWHHPLLALAGESDFLVIDRGGHGQNLEEHFFPAPAFVIERL